ncbi:hypothetical protein Lal_00034698 [Lupinus albus]|nr:hypothetical protein Lal_00034698 [Lupinus albus]
MSLRIFFSCHKIILTINIESLIAYVETLSREKLNGKIQMGRQVLEAYDFRKSQIKMECKFRRENTTLEVEIGDHTIKKSLDLSIMEMCYLSLRESFSAQLQDPQYYIRLNIGQ